MSEPGVREEAAQDWLKKIHRREGRPQMDT